MAVSLPAQQDSQEHQHAVITWSCYFLLGTGMLGRHMDRLLTICYLPICLLVIGLMVKWQGVLSQRTRILAAFGVFSAVMLAVPLMDVLLVGAGQEGPNSALALVLLSVVVVSVCDGLCQGAIFGDASALPPQYTHAVVGGTASSGFVVSLLRVITKASLPNTRDGLRQSTALYFGLAAAISAACFGVYAKVMPQLGVIRHYHGQQSRRLTADSAETHGLEAAEPSHDGNLVKDATQSALLSRQSSEDTALLIQPPAQRSHTPASNSPTRQQRPVPLWTQVSISAQGASPRRAAAHDMQATALLKATSGDDSLFIDQCGQQQAPCWRVTARRIWPLCAAIFFVYSVTLSIFPGFLSEDVHAAAIGDWLGIIFITVFNFADLVGKTLPFYGKDPSHHAILLGSLLRLLFLPLYFTALALQLHPLFTGALTFFLGISNGRLTARIMTEAPKGLVQAEAELAENVVVFCMVAGLTVGAFCGFLWIL